MPAPSKNTYTKNEATSWLIPNYWDIIAGILVIAVIILLGYGAKSMGGKFYVGETLPISLSPTWLPYYALRTVLRMFIAMMFSIVFTFMIGTWAAKNRSAERLLIPTIDILQSVPVLGFLALTVTGFITLFPGSLLGPECAAIFAIFTAQAWNMTFSFYQSVRNVPQELNEAGSILQLSAWQKFWRIEVPFAMPGLLWNAMISMSTSWIFIVASEAISVAHQQITLPGIGSYIALAIDQSNKMAVVYVILTMFIVILLYDQLLFRPLTAWSEKFKAEAYVSETEPKSWLLNLFQRTELLQHLGQYFSRLFDSFVNIKFLRNKSHKRLSLPQSWKNYFRVLITTVFMTLILMMSFLVFRFIFQAVAEKEVFHVTYLGLITAIRVLSLIALSSLIWIPIGVRVGLSPNASRIVQPLAQFCASFPMNLLFPLVVILIIKYNLNANIWVSPLMILGTQWYILFNVIAGTITLPRNLHYAVETLNVKGWLWWKRLILPGIFPYFITGAISAAGGAWNISIIAEAVSWGNVHPNITGLGAYIAHASQVGDFQRIALGIVVMSLYVVVINRCLWRPLYNIARERFQL